MRAAASTGQPGPSLKLSFVVMGLGIAVAIVGGVGIGATFASTLITAPAVHLPAHLHRHLDKGRYEIFQKIDSGDGFPVSGHDFATLGPDNVQVRNSIGAPVTVEPVADISETITRGSRTYAAAVTFDTPAADDYRIDIDFGSPPEVLLTRSLGDTARHTVPWLLTLAGGGALATAGLVLLIVGIVRRNRAERTGAFVPAYGTNGPYGGAAAAYGPAPTYTPPPPAWYPDPGGSGRHRWWDGTRWTDHLS